MLDNTTQYSAKSKAYAIVNTILLLLAITFSGKHSIELSMIFTCILLVYILIERTYTISKFDYLVVLLFLYEIVSWMRILSINCNDVFVTNQYLVLCYWFILRLSLNKYDIRELYLLLVSALCTLFASINVISFEIYKNKVTDAGFDNLYDFRYLHKPFGELNNIWATLFLISLLIVIFFFLCTKRTSSFRRWGLIICSIVICYSLIISFSRGIYICLFLILILLAIYICQIKINIFKKIILFIGLLAAVALPSLTCKNEVWTTLKMTETVSQKRSLENRLSSFPILLPIIMNNPIFGVGTNNYSLAVNEFIYEDDNRSFTNFAPNAISQLLVEKGILGTMLWGFVFFACIIIVIKRTQNKFASIIMLFLICVLFIRELSFPCILNSLKGQVLCSVLLLVFINVNDKENIDGKQISYKFFMPFIIVLTGLSLSITLISRTNANQYIKAISYMQEGEFDKAEKVICDMRSSTPVYVLSSSLYYRLFESTKEVMFLHKGINTITKAIKENTYDTRLIYTSAVMSYYAGKEKEAGDILRELVGKYPNNALYNISLGKYLYLIGDKNEAILHIVKSVVLHPGILNSDWWKSIKITDSTFSDNIRNEVYECMNIETNDPIVLAKYGKILFIEGNYEESKNYLTKAIKLLPNLMYPWIYLAIIAYSENDEIKFKEYVQKTKLHINNLDILKNTSNLESIIRSDISNYSTKYITWYSLPWCAELLDIKMVDYPMVAVD